MKISKLVNRIKSKLIPGKIKRWTLTGLLNHICKIGFVPRTIIDIGAAQGSFTRECLKFFQHSQYLLVEPLKENKNFLDNLARENDNIKVYYAAAASFDGEIILNVHEHLDGSSIMNETDGDSANGTPRKVESITLDSLLNKYNDLQPPYLIKLDVQGAELEVLKGAERTIKLTEYILMEVSFFKFFKDSPQFCDVIDFMKQRGFVPYDLTGLRYRPLDNALAQIDLAFVKENGIFRKYHNYATEEQRVRMIENYKKQLKNKSV